MKHRNSVVLIGVLLPILGISTHTIAGQPVPVPAQAAQGKRTGPPVVLPPGRVSGRVLRADDGRPLSKAVVTITREGQRRESTAVWTDSSGVFQFLEVAVGRYQIWAKRNGYVSQMHGQRRGGPGVVVTVEPGRHIEKIEFRLEHTAVISGSVTDEDNEPVEGLEVRAQRVRFLRGGRQRVFTVQTTRTDDLGNFRLWGLAPGFYYVQAGKRGDGVSFAGATSVLSYSTTYYSRALSRGDAQRVRVMAGSETYGIDMTIWTTRTFTISGVIIDAATRSSARQYAIGFRSGGGMGLNSLYGDDGTFTLHGLEPGDYNLVATVTDETGVQRFGYTSVRVVDADVRVVIDVSGTAEVRGEVNVKGDEDFSLADLYVSLEPDDENAVAQGAGIDENGRFTVRNVPEGHYYVQISGREQEAYLNQVRCGWADVSAQPLPVVAGQLIDDCTLVIARDVAQVSGRVTKDHEPIAGSVVVLIPVEPGWRRIARRTAVAQTNANGQFQMRGVVPGDYFVFAVAPSDDEVYYDLEFAERNRDNTTRLTVESDGRHFIELKFTPTR